MRSIEHPEVIDHMVQTIRFYLAREGVARKTFYDKAKISKGTGDAIIRGCRSVSVETLLASYSMAGGTHLALAIQTAAIRTGTPINKSLLFLLNQDHENSFMLDFKAEPHRLLRRTSD